MAEYSTVEPELKVVVPLVTVSSPVSFKVAPLLMVSVPVVVRFLPFRSRVPAELFKSCVTVMSLVISCKLPAPEWVRW